MNALPILLLGGAAAFFLIQKPKKAIANGKDTNGAAMPSGTVGTIGWRVIATGQGEYIAQWKRPTETTWRDAAVFDSKEEAAESIAGAIEAGDIP